MLQKTKQKKHEQSRKWYSITVYTAADDLETLTRV